MEGCSLYHQVLACHVLTPSSTAGFISCSLVYSARHSAPPIDQCTCHADTGTSHFTLAIVTLYGERFVASTAAEALTAQVLIHNRHATVTYRNVALAEDEYLRKTGDLA